MLGRTDRRWRMIALTLVFTLLGGATAVRLGHWQVLEADWLRVRAQRAIPRPPVPDVVRADILDRSGASLAQTLFRDRLVAHPNLMADGDVEPVLDELGAILDLGPGQVRARYAEQLADREDLYEILEQQLTPAQSLAVDEARASGRLPGIALEPTQVRFYPTAGGEPHTTLGNQLIGFVDAEGRGNKGVEQAHDDRLTGRVEPVGAALASLPGVEGLDGTVGGSLGPPPIRLTVVASLQAQLEKELHAAQVANRAALVSGIIMDAHNGAILAWASVPGYDANDYRTVAARGLEYLRDPIAADTFAPGSVMKALTVAAALSRGVVTPRSRVRDSARLPFEGAVIKNADHGSMGRITVTEAIAYSRNVATARIAAKLGPTIQKASQRLYEMWRRLGIGEPTGVDVASEEAGIVPDPAVELWTSVDLANRAFGQGVNVTLVQLARAFAALVNGGYLVAPHVSLEREVDASAPIRVLEPRVARQTREILEYVTGGVTHYAEGTLVPGYQVGGKTGTAQIWDNVRGRYKKKEFNFSFVGFVGTDDPEVVIAIRIGEARPKIHGQGQLELRVSSFELFRRIAKVAVHELGIPRSDDPDVGRPVPLSEADKDLTPRRYAQHRRERASGTDEPDGPARSGDREASDRAAAPRAASGGDELGRGDVSVRSGSRDAEVRRDRARARTDGEPAARTAPRRSPR